MLSRNCDTALHGGGLSQLPGCGLLKGVYIVLTFSPSSFLEKLKGFVHKDVLYGITDDRLQPEITKTSDYMGRSLSKW